MFIPRAQPHAQSLFLFPIAFVNDMIPKTVAEPVGSTLPVFFDIANLTSFGTTS